MTNQSTFPLEKALLGFLMQGPAHGYALHQRAEDELGRIWYMGISNVYGTLKDLEDVGHVESTLEAEESYPPRKVYHVTSAGRDSFLDWVRKPVPAVRDMRVEFLAKLYFFETLDLDGIKGLLAAQEGFCRERLEQLERSAQDHPDTFERLVLEFRKRRIETSMGWLQVCRRELT